MTQEEMRKEVLREMQKKAVSKWMASTTFEERSALRKKQAKKRGKLAFAEMGKKGADKRWPQRVKPSPIEPTT